MVTGSVDQSTVGLQVIAEILSGLWHLIYHRLHLLVVAFAYHSPTHYALCGPINGGHDVDAVFLCLMKVYSSSSSTVSTFSGTGASGNWAAKALTQFATL